MVHQVPQVCFLYVDDPNDRLGVNSTAPANPLHVVGNGSATDQSPIRVQNISTSGYAQILYEAQGVTNAWAAGVGGSAVGALASDFFIYNASIGTVLTLTTAGYVGINNTSPAYTLDVSGNVSGISIYASDDIVAFSDAKVKGDVKVIENAIEKIKEIRGVTFIRTDREDNQRHAGVIAQEVQKVLPEVVTTRPDDGTLAVAYGNLNALLIEAIKELTAKVEKLEQQLKDK